MNKDDTPSTTLSTAVIVISCMIDEKEEIYVVTADRPGTFLQTYDTSGESHIWLDGIIAYLPVKVNTELHQEFIYTDEKV